jgi:hypothetical protein
MFRLVSVKDYASHAQIEFMTEQIRTTFCQVFTEAYTARLAPVLQQAIGQGEVKTAADTETSQNEVLRGFSDLLVKPKFFSQPIATYARRAALREVLKVIYQGPGFDDDAAFILAFHDFNFSETSSAEEHYARVKKRLPVLLQQEVDDYFKILSAENRTLLKVDFLAIVNTDSQVQGFALLHLLKLEGKIILHIRQAATLRQGFGFVSAMAACLVDQYPHAIYEANQRMANQVLMKENLVGRQFIKKIPAVLHYSQDYYFGWRGKNKMIKLYLRYQQTKHPQKDLFTRGFWRETESIKPFFSRIRFNRDLFALQDDNFCKDNLTYLRQPAFRKTVARMK